MPLLPIQVQPPLRESIAQCKFDDEPIDYEPPRYGFVLLKFLTASSQQDLYLTGHPQITYFKLVYRRACLQAKQEVLDTNIKYYDIDNNIFEKKIE
jgi:hypothetical protein